MQMHGFWLTNCWDHPLITCLQQYYTLQVFVCIFKVLTDRCIHFLHTTSPPVQVQIQDSSRPLPSTLPPGHLTLSTPSPRSHSPSYVHSHSVPFPTPTRYNYYINIALDQLSRAPTYISLFLLNPQCNISIESSTGVLHSGSQGFSVAHSQQ